MSKAESSKDCDEVNSTSYKRPTENPLQLTFATWKHKPNPEILDRSFFPQAFLSLPNFPFQNKKEFQKQRNTDINSVQVPVIPWLYPFDMDMIYNASLWAVVS